MKVKTILKTFSRGTANFIILLLFLTSFFLIYPGESYFIFYPSIDTVYSARYTEEGFDSVAEGMRKELVLDILGDPISSWETAQGEFPGGQGPGTIEGWQYTHDAKCGFCDFAWLGRYVYFDKEGRVTSKHKRMHYD